MTTAYDFDFVGINGAPLSLKQFEGQALLVVNVASRCGFTPQYTGLQKLHAEYSPRGFSVIGVPCNQFLWQEPAKETEIAAFCEVTYHITFPMTEKTHVRGWQGASILQVDARLPWPGGAPRLEFPQAAD